MSTLDDHKLTFKVPLAPPQWRQKALAGPINGALVLSLWEGTISLIANEAVLSQDEQRYLAMIADHRREFKQVQARAGIEDVPETLHLANKLLQGPRPTPVFGSTGLRHLAETVGQSPTRESLTNDEQAEKLMDELRTAGRVIAELEMAERLLKWAIEKKENEEKLPTGETSDVKMDETV